MMTQGQEAAIRCKVKRSRYDCGPAKRWRDFLYIGVPCSPAGRLGCTEIQKSFRSSADKFDLHTDKQEF